MGTFVVEIRDHEDEVRTYVVENVPDGFTGETRATQVALAEYMDALNTSATFVDGSTNYEFEIDDVLDASTRPDPGGTYFVLDHSTFILYGGFESAKQAGAWGREQRTDSYTVMDTRQAIHEVVT